MGRRGNGEGTITRRKEGRWEARYYTQTVNGPKRKVLYGKTRAEAKDKLAKAVADRIDGIVYDDENLTVGEYLDGWLKGTVYGSVRRSTYDRDTYLVNNHIKPVLGRLRLKKLNSAHVQSFYRDRLDERLSGSTVHKMHDILRRGLMQAVKWHLVPRNVADAVKPPRPASKGDTRSLCRRDAEDAQSRGWEPPRSTLRPRRPHRHEAGRIARVDVVGRRPEERQCECQAYAHTDGQRQARCPWRAQDQEKPSYHQADAAGRRDVEVAP